MSKKQSNYWKNREQQHIKNMIKQDREVANQIESKLNSLKRNVEQQIKAEFDNYQARENITQSELFKRVSELDVKDYSKRAKKLVKTKDFSEQANYELKLYNLKMRVSRLELLKANIGLDLLDVMSDVQTVITDYAQQQAYDELERQAGILAQTVSRTIKKDLRTLVNSSYSSATFSKNIWKYQTQLKNSIDTLLTRFVAEGINPRVLSRELTKSFEVARYQSERLMRTETAKIQGDMQIKMYKEFDVSKYGIVTEPTACRVCGALRGQKFNVGEEIVGINMVPIHANCRCSTVPIVD